MAYASTFLHPALPSPHLLVCRHGFLSTSPIPRRTLILSSPPSAPRVTLSKAGGDPGRSSSRRPPPPPTGRKRGGYGTSRRSIIKKSFAQEQVDFTCPPSPDPAVGIIGGGAAGIACAMALEERGIRSTVFDTGARGLGGRMGTRVIKNQGLVFDHAAQFFTVSDSRFQALVDRWKAEGLVREWAGLIGDLEAGGNFFPLPLSPRFIGVKGMRPLADSILSKSSVVNVVRSCWISKIEPLNGMWYLSEGGKPQGCFDAIVIAHNGKCANRLLSISGLPLLAKQMKRLELSSIWALLAAFDEPLLPCKNGSIREFEGAFVKGLDALSWMGNNTRKLFPDVRNTRSECWTFLSTASYGKKNKVPQENIPNATAEKVKREILEAVEIALGLPKASLKQPVYTRVQLWGAALPTNTPGVPCIFDPRGRAGICGDWLLGSSIEAAFLSGLHLGDHIAKYFRSDNTEWHRFAIGLGDEFHALEGHDIGQFPSMKLEEAVVNT